MMKINLFKTSKSYLLSFCKQTENKDAAYDLFKNMFKTIVDQHAPLKTKFIRGTHAPFMNKELSKEIMHKSKLHDTHKKLKTKESWEAFKRQRNKCVSIKRKNIRSHFTELAGKCGNCNNRKFWSEIKPFLANEHSGKGQNIVLSENEIVVRDSTQVAEILNNYFINIVEINTGSKPHSLPCTETGLIDDRTIDEIIDRYSNHPSVTSIKSNLTKNPQAFSFKLASSSDIEKIISKLSLTTAIGFDGVPPKLVKLANKVISGPLSKLINETLIRKCHFPNAE